MTTDYEKAFHSGGIAIVPKSATELITVVLDPSILDKRVVILDDRPNILFRHIDKQPLRFLDDAQPMWRYLHINCIMACARQKCFHVQG